MTVSTFDELFMHVLGDIYYAEKQILKALPKLAAQASSSELRAALQSHRDETEEQVNRLEKAFELLGHKPKAVKCQGIEGILKEGDELLSEVDDDPVRDAGMITGAQVVEHYEIVRYGTLIAWADKLGYDEVGALLNQNLEEERAADDLLTEIAEGSVNSEAQEAAE
jgi:Uncharacterized protein conserved in bacteria